MRERGKAWFLKGMSLPELIAAMIIVSFLSGILVVMLLAGKKTYQASVARGKGRQDLTAAMYNITEDLKDTRLSFVTVSADRRAFSAISAYDTSGTFTTDTVTGAPVWKKFVVYYLKAGTTNLMRREVYGTFTAALTADELTAQCNGTGKLVASDVLSLSIATDAINKSMTLSVTVRNTSRHGTIDEQTQQAVIYPAN
ncbi:MAG: prepilin-type N-terminal cleavage/methylation domain-containing protein [Candidatus Eremiobacteraeota bacterium]|nr:prepilin-type N-terminal cleavage/methylation domain-containing protein [Candidatus Eremiobacteraeota bacterium]